MDVTRRIPAALGLVIFIGAVHQLSSLAPMIAMLFGDSDGMGAIPWLFCGAAVAQLVAGIAMSVGARHARLAVIAWTVLSVAAVIVFGRDETFGGVFGSFESIVLYVELLAGPLITLVVPLWLGDAPAEPKIPRAHVVSNDARPDDAAHDIVAAWRRFDLGVVLFFIGVTWIISTLVTRAFTLVLVLRAGGNVGGLFAELLGLSHAIAVGVLAIIAARRLLDPTVEPRRARRAVGIYTIVAVAGNLAFLVIRIAYFLHESDLSSEMVRTILVQWTVSGVLGLVIPLFFYGYAHRVLPDRTDGPVPLPPPSRIASAPAWAMLLVAPFLVSRMFALGIVDTNELSPTVMPIIGIGCAVLGLIFLVAGVATFVSMRSNEALRPSESTDRIARIASALGLGLAALFVLGWMFVVLGLDAAEGFRQQAPFGPLVKLVACAAALYWALTRRAAFAATRSA